MKDLAEEFGISPDLLALVLRVKFDVVVTFFFCNFPWDLVEFVS